MSILEDIKAVVPQYHGGVKDIEIANTLGLQRGAVDTVLSRLLRSGRINKSQRGVYAPQTEQLPLNMTQVQEV